MEKSRTKSQGSVASSYVGSITAASGISDITVEHGQAIIYSKQPYIVGEPGKTFVILQPIRKPPSYLTLSIIVTALCFFPTGIIAILRSLEVKRLVEKEKLLPAREQSLWAKRFIIMSVGLGLVIWFGVIWYVCCEYGINRHWATPWI